LDELKISTVINELLQAEYVMKNSTNNIHVENQDEAKENRWIKVTTGQHKETRIKVIHKQENKSKSHFILLVN
jgi:hypothetical protein